MQDVLKSIKISIPCYAVRNAIQLWQGANMNDGQLEDVINAGIWWMTEDEPQPEVPKTG